jgi:hypothetical protein
MEATGFTFNKPPARLVNHSDLNGWLLDWIGKIDDKSATWVLMLVYNLWLARNDARDSRKIEDPKSIAQKLWLGLTNE